MKRIAMAVLAIAVGALSPANGKASKSGCQALHRLAQAHSNDMARRDHLDHAGFANRAKRGARAENVAYGHASKARTIAQWWASPPHAANMLLPGCKAVASTMSRSGRHYWTMEIGQSNSHQNTMGRQALTVSRGSRRLAIAAAGFSGSSALIVAGPGVQ